MRSLVTAVVFVALSSFCLVDEAFGQVLDPLTAIPIPEAIAPPPADLPGEGVEGPIQLLAHVPDGTTGPVRWVGDFNLVYRNGADVVYALLAYVLRGGVLIETASSLTLDALPQDLFVDGSRVYVAARGSGGLKVLDISLNELTFLGESPGYDALAVVVAADVAYVGAGLDGLRVYDVSDPSAPQLVGTVETGGSANGLRLHGDYLYVANGEAEEAPGVLIFDVSDPVAPELIGSLDAPGFVTSVAVWEEFAFVAGTFGLLSVDVSNPAEPVVLDDFDANGAILLDVDAVGATFPQGQIHVMTVGTAGVLYLNAADPSNLQHTGSFDLVGDGLGVDILGTAYVLVSDRYRGVRMLAITGTDPNFMGGQDRYIGGFSKDVAFGGDHSADGTPLLFVADLGGLVRIADIEDGDAVVRGWVRVPYPTQAIAAAGDIAYVTDSAPGSNTGLTVIDASAPPIAPVVGSWGSPKAAFGLDLTNDDVLYLTHGADGLTALDVSDPTNPEEIGTLAGIGDVRDVTVRGNVAFTVGHDGGHLAVIDVSTPAAMSVIDSHPEWGSLAAIDLSQTEGWPYAYAADIEEGLRMINVSNPEGLTTVGLAPVSSVARDVAVGETWYGRAVPAPTIYVADDYYGMHVFAEGMHHAASFRSADRGMGVAVRTLPNDPIPDYVALAAGEAGFYLFEGLWGVSVEDVPTTDASGISSIYPNPAVTSTTASVHLEATGEVSLEVFDLLGRRVARHAGGVLSAGSHEMTVDVRGLAVGVYVLRLSTDTGVASQHFTVIGR